MASEVRVVKGLLLSAVCVLGVGFQPGSAVAGTCNGYYWGYEQITTSGGFMGEHRENGARRCFYHQSPNADGDDCRNTSRVIVEDWYCDGGFAAMMQSMQAHHAQVAEEERLAAEEEARKQQEVTRQMLAHYGSGGGSGGDGQGTSGGPGLPGDLESDATASSGSSIGGPSYHVFPNYETPRSPYYCYMNPSGPECI